VLFQQVAESFFDEFVERAFQINRRLFGFFLQILVDAGGQLFRSMPIIKIFIYSNQCLKRLLYFQNGTPKSKNRLHF